MASFHDNALDLLYRSTSLLEVMQQLPLGCKKHGLLAGVLGYVVQEIMEQTPPPLLRGLGLGQ